MPLHWTYEKYRRFSDLEQGDIIGYTPDLKELLSKYHQYFLQEEKYWGFLVLTQTCDLVRRPSGKKGSCGAKYVSLAIIRPIDNVLIDLCEHACKSPAKALKAELPGIFYEGSKASARELLSRVFNQNEQALGLFYLHPDEAIGTADPCVALLRVSIALHANDHYMCLVKARKGRLAKEFRPKLGWLVGNLYSRVATPDWDKKQLKKHIDKLLHPDNPNAPCWVSYDSVQTAIEKNLKLKNAEPRVAAQTIQAHRIPATNIAQERLEEVAKKYLPSVAEDDLREFLSAIQNDSILKNVLSDADSTRRRFVP